jgi:hypothetical protein
MEGEAGVELFQVLHNNRLRQRLRLPGSLNAVPVEEVSNLLVMAMLTRLQWSAGVDLPREPGLERRVVWSPGAAAALIPDRAAQLAELALREYALLTPPTPELVSPDRAVDAFLLYRWVQDTMLDSPETASVFWGRLVETPEFTMQDWVQVTPGVRSLRELHQAWDVWWQAEKQVLISEFGLEQQANAWLLNELNPVPRFYGLDAEEDALPLVPATLTDFAPYLEHPRFFSAMSQWILRLQSVRFRQSSRLNEQIRRFEIALEMASRSIQRNGRIEQRYFEEAVRLWSEALEMMP